MFHSLGAVQNMEPRPTPPYGQIVSPWSLWRAADDRLTQLERAVVPMLPRIQTILDNDAPEQKARGGNWHIPAAYLLARWGTGDARARGRQAFEDTARSSVAFFDARLDHRKQTTAGRREEVPCARDARALTQVCATSARPASSVVVG